MEDERNENKKSWNPECLVAIAAMANWEGGTLHLGVEDDGVPVGVPNARKLLTQIPNTVSDKFGILVHLDLINKNGLNLIDISIEPSEHLVACDGVFYCRSGSTSRKVENWELEPLIRRKSKLSWTDGPAEGYAIESIDPSVFRKFIERGRLYNRISEEEAKQPPETVLRNMGLMRGNALTRAAAIMFHENPKLISMAASIRVERMTAGSNILFMDELDGPMFLLVDRAMDLIFTKYLVAPITFDGIIRVENYPYPRTAIREGLLNAIANNDYSRGVPIKIDVLDDSLVISNTGDLPLGYTFERLAEDHASMPRNAGIAAALMKSGYVERAGTGLSKMRDAYLECGMEPPVINLTGNYVQARFMDIVRAKGLGTSGAAGEAILVNGNGLSPLQKDILALLKSNGPLSAKELSERTGHSGQNVRKMALNALIEKGLVSLTIPDSPRNKNQRYQLTSRGIER